MIILFVFAEAKIIKKADPYNRVSLNFYLSKKFYRTVIIGNKSGLTKLRVEDSLRS